MDKEENVLLSLSNAEEFSDFFFHLHIKMCTQTQHSHIFMLPISPTYIPTYIIY